MRDTFLESYQASFGQIEGWFSFDAALLFMAYNQVVREAGIGGDVLEIGVHHGLSTIAVAALRQQGSRTVAVDLFEDQASNVSGSGHGNRARFQRNLAQFHPDLSFMEIIAAPSSTLTPQALGTQFSFCHIDGGHSRKETFDDLSLCNEITLPGGLIALDDYFNPFFPGVCEGAIDFQTRHPRALVPAAVGFNKVLFQKRSEDMGDLNEAFRRRFPHLKTHVVQFWNSDTLLFPISLTPAFDISSSSPMQLQPKVPEALHARLEPDTPQMRLAPGASGVIAVSVTNTSSEPFPFGEQVFGLSYHLLSEEGDMLTHDHKRTYLTKSVQPAETISVTLPVVAPEQPGRYQIELDLVWEHVYWLANCGSPTSRVHLIVS